MTARTERFSHALLDGVTLHFAESGSVDAPLVILLHGGGANLHWWDHLTADLAESLRVIALDFRGHGDSEYPEVLQVGAFHRDLEALIAYLRAPVHALIGHSLGAHVALHHAATHGGVDKLVLVEPSRGAERRERRRSRLALAARRSYASREEAIARFRFVPDAPGASEALRCRIAAHSVRREPDGPVGSRWGFKFDPRWFGIATAPRPDPAAVQAATLVIRGCQSRLLTAEGARQLCEELPHARLAEVEGAGHNVHIERPDAVLAALLAHLRGSRADAAQARASTAAAIRGRTRDSSSSQRKLASRS